MLAINKNNMQPQNSFNPQNLIQHISSIMPQYCDKCGARHDNKDLEIVFNSNSKAVCKLNCPNCGNSYMIHVNSPAEGMVAAKRSEYKSEITAQEITKFSNIKEIDSNEVIDVFNSLKSVSSIDDFNNLF